MFPSVTRSRAYFTLTRPLAALMLALAAIAVVVAVSTAQEEEPQRSYPKPEPGILIARVAPDGPAAEAGVSRGDILLAIDGDRVNTVPELTHMILSQDPGDEIELTLLHGDEEITVTVTLSDENGRPGLGIQPAQDPFAGSAFSIAPGAVRAFPMGPGGMMLDAHPMEQMMGRSGAAIVEIVPDGPAAAAGLQAGDVISAVNGTAVESPQALVDLLAETGPGDEVSIEYSRDGESATAQATLGEHPDDAARGFLGVQVGPAVDIFVQRPDGMEFRGPRGLTPGGMIEGGVLIARVADDSPAAEAGLAEGDWISAVDGEAVSTPQDLVSAVRSAAAGDEIVLTVTGQDGETEDITVVLGENEEGDAYLGIEIGAAFQMRRGGEGEPGARPFFSPAEPGCRCLGGEGFYFGPGTSSAEEAMPFFFMRPGFRPALPFSLPFAPQEEPGLRLEVPSLAPDRSWQSA